MNYTNEQIRRQDRLLEKEKAISLLKNGEYGVLSMQDEENGAYGVPINYVWNKKNSIYIHCAPEGRKLHCIKRCNTVSFCIIGKTHIISNQFTTEYESIILKCRAYIGLNEEERINALGEFYQFNLSSCIRQQNSLTAQFVSFSLSNLANIFYPPPQFLQ